LHTQYHLHGIDEERQRRIASGHFGTSALLGTLEDFNR